MADGLCELYCFDEKKVSKVKDAIDRTNIQSMVQIFKALADETRLKVAFALSEENELCVCDAANIIGCSLATASHHLRFLRKMGLAKYRKEGKLAFYSLEDEHVKDLIRIALIHGLERKNDPEKE